jgi:hypothetical protein
MPTSKATSKATFAMSGRTFHKGDPYAATDPAVIARPDLFNGVDVPKPATKTIKKDGTR